jgi:hypothetical protein
MSAGAGARAGRRTFLVDRDEARLLVVRRCFAIPP